MRQLLPVPKIIWTQVFIKASLKKSPGTSGIPPHSSIIQPPPVRTWGSWRRVVADGHWEMFDLSFPIVFTRSMILEVGKFRRIWQVSRILLLLVWKIVYLLGHPESNPRTLEHLHSQTWVGLTLMFFCFFFPWKKSLHGQTHPHSILFFSLAYVFLLFSPWCCWWCPGFWCLHPIDPSTYCSHHL